MAKKVKKVVKKAATPKKTVTHHHAWAHHDFLIVVAGGFLVIVLVLFLSDSTRMNVMQYMGKSQPVQQEQAQMENQNEKIITIKDFTYSPTPLVVKKGTTVTWTNADSQTHSATADDGSFNTGLLAQGESGSVTYNDVGEHPYHCSVHPNMISKIVVEE